MAQAARRSRRSPVRSKALKSEDTQQPRRARAALGVSLFILFFAFVWLFDGNWTAESSMIIFGFNYAGGWGVHLLITAIQVLPAVVAPWLPRRTGGVALLIWFLAVPCGIFNVFSSAIGIMPYIARTSAPQEVLNIVATLLGQVTAFLPEKAVAMLVLLLHRIYRG